MFYSLSNSNNLGIILKPKELFFKHKNFKLTLIKHFSYHRLKENKKTVFQKWF